MYEYEMDTFVHILPEGNFRPRPDGKEDPTSLLKGPESVCTSQLESFAAGVSIHLLSLTLITDEQRCSRSVTLVEFMLLSLALTIIRPTHCVGVWQMP